VLSNATISLFRPGFGSQETSVRFPRLACDVAKISHSMSHDTHLHPCRPFSSASSASSISARQRSPDDKGRVPPADIYIVDACWTMLQHPLRAAARLPSDSSAPMHVPYPPPKKATRKARSHTGPAPPPLCSPPLRLLLRRQLCACDTALRVRVPAHATAPPPPRASAPPHAAFSRTSRARAWSLGHG
jgi:hypothetical protein